MTSPSPQSLSRPAGKSPAGLLAIEPAKSLLLLFCIWLVCYLLISALYTFVLSKFPSPEKALRIGSVLQDLILFILPALATAMLSTRLPATLLAIDRQPRLRTVFYAVFALFFSTPAMEWIVQWNNSLQLPESMSAIENWMRNAEQSATSSINLVLGGKDVGSLVVSILIVGVLAGLSEELLFRGALQRILYAWIRNAHMAIWISAILFSAMHFQFYGFVPRLLLGAFFGYLLWWSGSLWLPVIAHMMNNTLFVVVRWMGLRHGMSPENISVQAPGNTIDIIYIIASVLLSALCLWAVYRTCRKGAQTKPAPDALD